MLGWLQRRYYLVALLATALLTLLVIAIMALRRHARKRAAAAADKVTTDGRARIQLDGSVSASHPGGDSNRTSASWRSGERSQTRSSVIVDVESAASRNVVFSGSVSTPSTSPTSRGVRVRTPFRASEV